MQVLRLLLAGPFERLSAGLASTLLAAFTNVMLIALVNSAAERASLHQPIGMRLPLLYALIFAIFYYVNQMSLKSINALVQHRLAALQRRVAAKVRTGELATIEALGRGRLLATIGQETNQLAQVFPILISASQGLVLLPLSLAYVATLSMAAFFIVSAVTAVGLVFFAMRRAVLRRKLTEVSPREAEMLDAIGDVTDGFQEIRLHAGRNDAVYINFRRIVDALAATMIDIGRTWSELLMFGNAFLYLLVGIVVLVLPFFFTGYNDVIFKITAVAIFCVGPVSSVTSAVPLLDRANVGLQHVYDLEQLLDTGGSSPTTVAETSFTGFRTIALDSAEFGYGRAGESGGFRVGPLDLTLKRGELVFVIGGNGGGKSTMMKLLCGLYQPGAGCVRLDGSEVNRQSLQAYRELFTCIFTDFHLFPKLYGLEDSDPVRVNALLVRFDLAGKVTFSEGAFSTQSLSTGQRKRLAMVVALLEDRPVILLDEWAADQDAEHRHMFYTELLPELKRQNKIIVAVTHDDRYWAIADRRILIDLGRIVPEQPLPRAS